MSDLLKNTLKITKRASNHTLSTIKPDKPENAILSTLARDGPMTQVELDKTIGNYGGWESDHHTIKRRLKGLRWALLGLLKKCNSPIWEYGLSTRKLGGNMYGNITK